MTSRTLGVDLVVSPVGLGCMGFSHAYGAAVDEGEAVKIIREAFELGYTFFDTAECYLGEDASGRASVNEELVGKALGACRDDVVIATKFGVKHDERRLMLDSSPETIRRSIDGSLKRLNVDCIDLYYQHRIDPNVAPEVVADVMTELIAAGKIRRWGVSEATEDYLRRAHAVCPVTCVQNRYSMMARGYERLFPVLEELNVGFVAFSPLANGLLSDAYAKGDRFTSNDYRSVMPQYSDAAFEQNQALFALLRRLAQEKDATPAQISLAWQLGKKPYIVPIPGSRKLERIRENFRATAVVLTPEEVCEIDKRLDHTTISPVFGGSPVKKER